MAQQPTLVALSTAEGEGAVALLRLSGPEAIAIAERCFRGAPLSTQPSHTLHVGKMVAGTQVLDEVVVGLFRAPRSYTGEDVVEISCHGSPFIVQRLLSQLCTAGAHLAQAGDFTKRAFLHGKLDLAQAEAVASLIAAESDTAHRVAMQQMRGHVSARIKAFRKEIVSFASLLELELDFAEEDILLAKREALSTRLHAIQTDLQGLISSFATAQAFREGVQVAIAGPPNAGKSTLFNALVAEDKAMVSDIAGTTRDYIEAEVKWHGTRFRFTDTAGLRHSNDPLEQEGVRRSKARIAEARVLLLVVDLSSTETTAIQALCDTYKHPTRRLLLVGNKIDLLTHAQQQTFAKLPACILLSSKTKEGFSNLQEQIYACSVGSGYREGVWISHLRHHQLLTQAYEALHRVQAGITTQAYTEWLAADLQEALRALGQITGEIYSEELLQHIFSQFCIGK